MFANRVRMAIAFIRVPNIRLIHHSPIVWSATDLQISKLRQKTGMTFNLCREALNKHENNLSEAEAWLKAQAARQKITKGSRAGSVDEEEEEDDEDELANENPLLMDDILGTVNDGSHTTVLDVGSLRLDAFAKVAFSTTRAKVEESFYKGDIYVNGETPVKKSIDLAEGDEIDIVKQINPDDSSMVDIRRVQIVKLPDKATQQGRFKISVKRWADLTVKNYKE